VDDHNEVWKSVQALFFIGEDSGADNVKVVPLRIQVFVNSDIAELSLSIFTVIPRNMVETPF